MRFKIGSRIHEVVRRGDHAIEVDGERVEASAVLLGGARFEGQTAAGRVRVFVAREGDRVFARIGERTYNLRVATRATSGSSADSENQGGLEAPMPGRVSRVAVATGDLVKRGQELIVVEAMKMENALVAPIEGVVKSLAVKVGDMVTPGSALIVIEAQP